MLWDLTSQAGQFSGFCRKCLARFHRQPVWADRELQSGYAGFRRSGNTTTFAPLVASLPGDRSPKSFCMRSADSLSDPSNRCPYRSIVNLMEACPRRSAIFFG